VRAGHLGAELRGADLVDVRWGALEIASAVQVTVRDERWGTVRPRLRRADVREDAGGFTVDIEAAHGDVFVWRGTVAGSADGTLDVAMEGTAERDFVYRRIGVCVLHPWETYVGAGFATEGAGARTVGTFPREIAPQPLVDGEYRAMVPPFARLEVVFDGRVRADFAFEGEADGWELEDQRNWTDASFKTYPTPLRRSAPRTLRRGERLRQRLRVRIAGDAPPFELDDGPVLLHVGEPDGCAAPSVGLTAPPHADVDPGRLAALAPAHLRVAADVPGDLDGLRAAATLAAGVGVPMEVALLLGDDEDGARLDPVVRALGDAPIVRVLLLRRTGATAGGDFVSRLRPRLGPLASAPVGGGTASHFSELNRAEPDASGLDALALAMSPQVHDVDEPSIVRTLAIQAQVGERVRRLAGGADVAVSPLTLAAHDPAAPDDEIDARVGSDFAAAWTVGSACALASAGVRSLTLHERADRTVLASEALARAFRLLSARAGRELDVIAASRAGRVGAMAALGMPVLLANLTPQTQEVRLEGMASGGRVLGPYEVAEVARSPR
jgi:D-apionolactonase